MVVCAPLMDMAYMPFVWCIDFFCRTEGWCWAWI